MTMARHTSTPAVARAARPVPEVPGVLTRAEAQAVGEWIASEQLDSGEIPWFPGGHTDPWDHVESAMGLTVAGLWEAADKAYEFLRREQREDGSWPKSWVNGVIDDPDVDSNFTAYIAVGVWHHYRVTGDAKFLERMWPCVQRALNLVLLFQGTDGRMHWERRPDGLSEEVLVTGNASIHHALRCGVLIAEELGQSSPDWELAADKIAHMLREHPELFTPKESYSMDWYYPVLGGVLVGEEAARRLDERWDDFVVRGLGIRCVDHNPWVTGAETCELVLSLEAVGRHEQALEQFRNMQHLRETDGSLWTGLVFTDGKRWPVETSTWTAAAMLLAADALSRTTPGNDVFRYVSASTEEKLAGKQDQQ